MHQESLVKHLQTITLDHEVKVSDILREALVVSTKLEEHKLKSWITNELNGYSENDEIPEYRLLHGKPKYFNPYNGLQPLIFENEKEAGVYSERLTNQS
ncbi:MAG: hypothetical protein WA981_09865, partial [Glaciecola sp.]